MTTRNEIVLKHYQSFFDGHKQEVLTWENGPKNIPYFRVFRAEPGPQTNLWSYASIGASGLWSSEFGLFEFVVLSPIESPRLVEIVTMVAYYHGNHSLGFGQVLPIGEPWMEGSECNHLLISKPYPLGPGLEICDPEEAPIQVAWLLPITEKEKDFKLIHGTEALEQLFEDKGLEFWNIQRKSLV